jgi:hypothetical protein
MILDIERFEQTALSREPFEYLVVPEFVNPEAQKSDQRRLPEDI